MENRGRTGGNCSPHLAVVKALVRWATGKRLTKGLPKPNLITLFPPGMVGYSVPDRIYGSTYHQLAAPISGDPGRVSDS